MKIAYDLPMPVVELKAMAVACAILGRAAPQGYVTVMGTPPGSPFPSPAHFVVVNGPEAQVLGMEEQLQVSDCGCVYVKGRWCFSAKKST